MIEIILAVCAVIAEFFSFFIISDSCFKRRFVKTSIYIIIVIAVGVINAVFLQQLLNMFNVVSKLIFVLFEYFILLSICYIGHIWKKIFVVFAFYIFLYMTDYLVVFFMMFFSGQNIQDLRMSRTIWALALVFSKTIFVISSYILGKRLQDHFTEEKKPFFYWVQILIIPIAMILNIALVIFYAMKENHMNLLIGIDIIILFVANILFLFLEQKLARERKTREENILLFRKIESEEQRAKLVLDNYREQRKLTHDFRSHLYTLRGLIHDKQYKEVEKYLNRLLQEEAKTMAVVHTNHPVIDAVLNQFYLKANNKGILMEFEVNNLEKVKIPENELVIILSNLLENAIEAAEKVKEEKRIIIRILSKREKVIFSVRNTTIYREIGVEGQIKTTKENILKHGYGLENVKRIVIQNQGEYALESRNGWFQFSVIL